MFLAFRLFLVVFSAFAIAEVSKPTKCPTGEHWISAHKRKAYYRADGTLVKATNVKAHCRRHSAGYEIWKPKLKPGFPEGWLRKTEKKPWTDEEIESVLEALELIPKILWNNIEGIYRLGKDASGESNPASHQKGKVVLYDSAFESKVNLAHVLGHELSHELFDSLTAQQRVEYAFHL